MSTIMLDSDELGAYDPTTPYKPPPPKKAHPRPARPGNKPVAGPSSRPTGSSNGSNRAANSQVADTHEGQAQIVIGDSEDEAEPAGEGSHEVVAIPASKTARKTIGPRGTANGRGGGRGRGKAGPPHKGNRSADAEERMEVDEDPQVIEVDDGAPPARAVPRPRNPARPLKPDGAAQANEKVLRELEQARRQLQAAATERDKLSKQLEELFQIRHTEPEQTLEDTTAQYEARVKTQEGIIQELTSQLANVKALAGSEKSYMLHFLTREAADAEKEGIEKEVGRWKEIAKRKDVEIAAMERRIEEMRAEEKTLRAELDAEIGRGKSLAARNPQTTSRPGPSQIQDPKQLPVLKLYEDLTNLLVLGVKTERGEFVNLNLTEEIHQCVYTVPPKPDEDANSQVLSLSFTLRHTWVRPDDVDSSEPITSKDQLEEKVRYQPIDLDKESPRFVEALEFFRDPFLFSYDQMPVFLKTLTDKMTTIQESLQNGEDDDDDVVEVIPTGK